MLPTELQAAPPRDLAGARAILAKNRALVWKLVIGAVVLPPAIFGLMWMKYGEPDALGWGLAAGLGGLVALFAFAMHVQGKRALALYRDGIAVLGVIRGVEAPPDRAGNAYITLHVEFKDRGGATRVGRCMTIGNQRAIDRKAGDEVAVLYIDGAPQRFAVYTPGLGLTPGVAS